jgi:MoxR-like ATPase
MEEGQVTVDGKTYKLPNPFIVIATQNPTGAAGTQLLPDSQMDRFTIRTSLGYPKPEDEKAMVLQRQGRNPMEDLQPLLRPEHLTYLQDEVAKTFVNEAIVDYVVRLIDATRHHSDILRGASPRATLSVVAVSKAIAQLRGRDYVVPKDVQEAFLRTIPHRLLLSNMAQSKGLDCGQILRDILNKVEVPHIR